MDDLVGRSPIPEKATAIHIAAVGDLHVQIDSGDLIRDALADVTQHADMLLLAGDLTDHGTVEEGMVLAQVLDELTLPVIAVFGNHDYHQDAQDLIRMELESARCVVLECEGIVLDVHGMRVGIAGAKGFGGGFAGACGSEFGEPEMKAFIRHTRERAMRLRECLRALDPVDLRIALTHYAPTPDTLLGERLEIYPFLGSHLLGAAIDGGHCQLALHGHAHHGCERGTTTLGTPVRNVARPVVQGGYRLLRVGPAVAPIELR